jgi:hypothetical protein
MAACSATVAHAQAPFFTDDADVTGRGGVHVEVFDEHDWLPASQSPHVQQNTFNIKVNYGLGNGLELDVDGPLITILNEAAFVPRSPAGIGDLDFGVKYNFQQEREGSPAPALSLATYIEVPTGQVSTGLGSGLVDVWVYMVVQKSLPRDLVAHFNGGYLFYGNTSTGAVGITTARGHVATMGGSLVRAMNKTVTLGVDVTAAVAPDETLARAQFEVLVGGNYALGERFTVNAGVIAGRYAASPRWGLQIGISWDPRVAPTTH